MSQEPSIGRIVHFRIPPGVTAPGQPIAPAVITRIRPEGSDEGMVSLMAFLEHQTMPFTSVPRGDVDTPGTWFWPPRVSSSEEPPAEPQAAAPAAGPAA